MGPWPAVRQLAFTVGRNEEHEVPRISSPQRAVRVGFVGTATSGRRLAQVAERMDAPIRLVSVGSETPHGAHQKAMQVEDDVDVILYSGPLAYDLAVAQGGLAVPSLFVPPGGPALPTALLRAVLHEDLDLRRMSIDSVAQAEVEDSYEEIGIDVSGVHVMEYRESATPNDFLTFHRTLHAAGSTVAAITTLPAVAAKLEEQGTPALVMRPDAMTLRNALNTALLVGGGASLDNERMAIIVVRLPQSLTSTQREHSRASLVELKLSLMLELLPEARRMGALMMPRDDTSALMFVSMGSLRAATQDLSVMPLVERVRTRLTFEPEIGIGVGRTASEAEKNADHAADLGHDSAGGSVVMIGPDEAMARIPHDPSSDVPPTPSPKGLKEVEILRRLLDALAAAGQESKNVEAEQVADLLGVTLRTARRYMRDLVSADLAWQLPPTKTQKVGRPPIPYRLLDHRLPE